MKKGIFLLPILLCCLGISVYSQCCKNSSNSCSPSVNASVKNDRVEVIYFHGKQRCASCVAVEKVINEMASSPMENVSFRVVDMTTEEGKQLADRFEISFSSLLVGSRDLTSEAFRYAHSKPEVLKELIRTTIKEQR